MSSRLTGQALLAAAMTVLAATAARATEAAPVEHRWFTTSDHVKLHYLESGRGEPAVILIPGWLMPAGIFDAQIQAFSGSHRVLAFDPRGQGSSEAPAKATLGAEARARDIKELIEHAGVTRFVLVGWSLGVMETLDFTTRYPHEGLAGLVLVDNSIGMADRPAVPGNPTASGGGRIPTGLKRFQAYMYRFVRSMFAAPPSQSLLALLDASTRRLSPARAGGLLRKPYPREYYRSAVLACGVSVLYAITPRFRQQGQDLLNTYPRARVSVFERAGHALFVDEAARFNDELLEFLAGVG